VEEQLVTGFDVTPAELQDTRTMVDDIAHDVMAEVARLTREVDDLLEVAWTGRSAVAFAGGWEQWKSGVRDTLRALDSMAGLLGVAGRNYRAGDDSVTHRFARFTS
jgi:WXG100 family type VII secretion target